ncbi:MAG: ATP-binding protein [Geobacteraceae bacterium]|nr:ATP-binding protein [Geobacteraceae bacterium]
MKPRTPIGHNRTGEVETLHCPAAFSSMKTAIVLSVFILAASCSVYASPTSSGNSGIFQSETASAWLYKLRKLVTVSSSAENGAISRSWNELTKGSYISHRTFGLAILIGIVTALTVIAFILFMNRSLRIMVRQRTAELRTELDERKRMENQLIGSEERLSRFFEAAFEGILFHVDGVIVDINPAVTEILGYRPSETFGRNLIDFIAAESKNMVLDKMRTGEPGPYEVYGVRSDGAQVPLEIRARSIDIDGAPARVVGFRDISERKNAENELHRYQCELEARTESLEAIHTISDKLYRSLDLITVAEQAVYAMMLRSNSPSVALFLLDRNGGNLDLLFSQGFPEPLLRTARKLPVRGSLTGLSAVNRCVTISTDLRNEQRLTPSVKQALVANGYSSVVSLPLMAEERVLGALNLLYRDTPPLSSLAEQELLVIGHTVGLAISNAINVAHLREEMAVRQSAEEALRQLNAQLEQRVAERTLQLSEAKERAEVADRLKSAFLATMSHELRTPLNSIIGFTGILQQGLAGPLNEEQKKQMDMVRNSASHLLELINDVLDLSKIEAGQLTLAVNSFDLRASVEKVSKTVQPLAEAKGLDLEIRIDEDVSTINSDQRRVEQILLNLLSNAVKFTEKGMILVKCFMTERGACISVTDTGIGISDKDLCHLFKPFRQLDSGLTRRFDGTGLGLSICSRLAECLGGEIGVESIAGKGSTFSVILPVREGAQ